ncbi:MAG TPA: hypothetical protein DDE71_09680 [Tenacibaculum sp.]|nr:hypothetical protein [Tenacibaculum sp.]
MVVWSKLQLWRCFNLSNDEIHYDLIIQINNIIRKIQNAFTFWEKEQEETIKISNGTLFIRKFLVAAVSKFPLVSF